MPPRLESLRHSVVDSGRDRLAPDESAQAQYWEPRSKQDQSGWGGDDLQMAAATAKVTLGQLCAILKRTLLIKFGSNPAALTANLKVMESLA